MSRSRGGGVDRRTGSNEEARRYQPSDAQAYVNLVGVYLRKERLDDALAAAKEAVRLKAKRADAHNALGYTLYKRGYGDQALTAYRQALSLQRDYTTAQINLALALDEMGRRDEALSAYKDAARLQLADDAKTGLCYNAACIAAAAGCGRGQGDFPFHDQSRGRWRQQALDWLRSDLAHWTKQLANPKPEVRARVRETLVNWQREPDLVGLRDESALGKLPRRKEKRAGSSGPGSETCWIRQSLESSLGKEGEKGTQGSLDEVPQPEKRENEQLTADRICAATQLG